ncbi:MAG: hypothetical protein ACRCSO_07360 [Sphingomonas sp.]
MLLINDDFGLIFLGLIAGGALAADPVTVRRAAIPLSFNHLANARAVPPGDVQLVERDARPGEVVVARYPSPPTLAGWLVQRLGVATKMPEALRHRLFAPSPTMVLVRPRLASPPPRA